MNNTTAKIYFLATNLLYRSTPRACHANSEIRKPPGSPLKSNNHPLANDTDPESRLLLDTFSQSQTIFDEF